MINTTTTSPFDAPPLGALVAVELDPRRQLAHRAIAGQLAGYSGATLDAYRLDLRQWVMWLDTNGVELLNAQRALFEHDPTVQRVRQPLGNRASDAARC